MGRHPEVDRDGRMSMAPINLMSDTQTLPTEKMYEAMRQAGILAAALDIMRRTAEEQTKGRCR